MVAETAGDGNAPAPRAQGAGVPEDGLVALVQLRSGADPSVNLDRVERWIERAAASGALVVALPENFARISDARGAERDRQLDEIALRLDQREPGWVLTRMAACAQRHGIWLLLGSIPERERQTGALYNTTVVLAPDGTVAASYRKVHLFDVQLPDRAEYRESETFSSGVEGAVVQTPLGRLGLSICYDVRFAELYRAYARQGVELLAVPAAFTTYTGRAHWHVLLRARAIENQCYVLAPAQVGQVTPSRSCYGHSLVVDPWGEVVAELSDDREGLVTAPIQRARLDEVRARLPALRHRRL
jgi:predicted amidohydrolase